MASVSVQHVRLRPTNPVGQSASDKPMVWAVRKDGGGIVHVASLTREERGLKCECECPACKSSLQAVNAGVDAEHFKKENTLGQFFRHPPGQQRDGCLLLMARVAALQLLFGRGEIDLPGPRQQGTVTGASGAVYIEEVRGPGQRLKVLHRAWIDTQSATLTLEDGRVVMLRLASDHRVGNDGKFDGVIAIQVDDPEVASWPAEKILQHAQLDDGFLCWQKHWSDAQLQAQAQGLADEQARTMCDWVPDADDSVEMTAAQRSESALHLAVKMILAEAGELRSPVHHGEVRHASSSGRILSEQIRMALGVLKLSSVVLEKRMGQVVPDVMCKAFAPGEGTFDLMIEVAFTHRVDEIKRQKIVAMNMACMEIDITKFQKSGRITLKELADEVLNNRANKYWIFHPAISRLEWGAQRDLAMKVQEIQVREAVASRMKSWLDALDGPRLLRVYLDAVIHRWSNDYLPHVAGEYLEWEALVQAMKRRGWNDCDESVLVGPGGILHCLVTIRDGRSTLRLGKVCRPVPTALAFASHIATRRYSSYALMALKAYSPTRSAAEQQQLQDLRTTMINSLKRGETTYARSNAFDSLIVQLFPEMATQVTHQFGTTEDARKQQKLQHQAEQEKARAQERIRQQQAAQRELEEKTRALAVEIEKAARIGWAAHTGFINDLAQILGRSDVVRLRSQVPGLDDVLTSAWNAREQGVSLANWYRSQAPLDLSAVRKLQLALKEAWLTM